MNEYRLTFEFDPESSGIELEGFLDRWLSDILGEYGNRAGKIAAEVDDAGFWQGSIHGIPARAEETDDGVALKFRLEDKDDCATVLLGLLQAGTDFEYLDDVNGRIDPEELEDYGEDYRFSNVRKRLLEEGEWADDGTFAASVDEIRTG